MKIRKVDDKPMVIHTKEKAKIHAHEPRIKDYQDLSETIENLTLPSRPRTRIFTLQEEQVHLQPGQ